MGKCKPRQPRHTVLLLYVGYTLWWSAKQDYAELNNRNPNWQVNAYRSQHGLPRAVSDFGEPKPQPQPTASAPWTGAEFLGPP